MALQTFESVFQKSTFHDTATIISLHKIALSITKNSERFIIVNKVLNTDKNGIIPICVYDLLLKRDEEKKYSNLIQRVLCDQFMTIYKKSDNKIKEKLVSLHRSWDNDKVISVDLFNKLKLSMIEIDTEESCDSISDSDTNTDTKTDTTSDDDTERDTDTTSDEEAADVSPFSFLLFLIFYCPEQIFKFLLNCVQKVFC